MVVDLNAITYNLVLEQGATFVANVSLLDANNNPLDVTNYTAQSMMRRDYQSTNSYSFQANLALGLLTLYMSANNTANVTPGRYVYDVFLYNTNGVVTKVLDGLINVLPAVTLT